MKQTVACVTSGRGGEGHARTDNGTEGGLEADVP